MAKGKKISEQPIIESLSGNEMIPLAKNGANAAVTPDTIKEYVLEDVNDVGDIPTKVSQLENDSNFQTKSDVNDLLDGFAPKSWLASTDQEVARINTALVDGLNDKVEKVDGKGLSTNDFTDADKSKLDGIAENAQVNVLEGVKVNGVALSIASKIVNILIATGTANGTISVQGTDVPVKGLAALAYKANVSADDLTTALKAVIDAKAEQTEVTELSGKIDVLNGTGVGSVSKAITDAFNDFATKVSDDGVVNSYKELIDWAAEHGADATELAASIQRIDGLLDGIGGEGEPMDVKTAIANAISDLNIGNHYTKTETDALLDGKADKSTTYTKTETDNHIENRVAILSEVWDAQLEGAFNNLDNSKVDKVEGKQLSTEDFTTALKEKLQGLTNYDDATLTAELNALKTRLDTLVGSGDVTAVIDTFQEIENFLQGVTNTDTLTGLLQEMKSEIVQLCADTYLPLSGGTLSNNTPEVLKINRNSDTGGAGIRLSNNVTSGFIGIAGSATQGLDEGDLYYNKDQNRKILHTGNYSSTIFNGTSSQFLKADGSVDGTAYWSPNNDGSGSGLDADLLDGKQGSEYCVNLTIESGNDLNNIAVSGIYRLATGVLNSPVTATVGCTLLNLVYDTNSRNQVFFDHSTNKTWYRYRTTDGWKAWREFAFTDSNVASADKLTTKQLTNEDLNEIKDRNLSLYYGLPTNTCANKPTGITSFSLQVYVYGNAGYIQVLNSSAGFYIRVWKGDLWTAWAKMASVDDAVAKLTTKQLTNEDLNTIKDREFTSYFSDATNTCSNKPANVNAFSLQVFASAGNNHITQILTSSYGVTAGNSYKRFWNNTTWSNWKKLLTEDDPAYKLTTNQLTNEDLNTIKDVNFSVYAAYGNNTIANKPDGVSSFYLQVYGLSDNYLNQVLISTNGTIYRRTYNNAWTAWKKMLTEDDLPKTWVGTETEYNAIATKDANTTYYIKE